MFFLSLLSFGRLPQLTAAIELVNEISKQLTERKNEAVTEISDTFDELEKALHQRKTALITEVENICSAKQKVRAHSVFFCILAIEHQTIIEVISLNVSNRAGLDHALLQCSTF